MYQTPPYHIRLLPSSPLLIHPVPPCTFHILLLREFYSPLFGHTGTSLHLLPPRPPGYWYTSFFFLAGPGPLHEIGVRFSVFAKFTVPCKYLFIPTPSLSLPYISRVFSPVSPCFLPLLAVALPFFLSFLFYFYFVPPKLLYGHHLLVGFILLSFHVFSTTLFPPYYSSSPFFVNSLPYRSINYGWQPLT